MKATHALYVIVAFVIASVLGVCAVTFIGNTLVIELQNNTSDDISCLQIHITGHVYALGLLPSGQNVQQQLNPEGESDVELVFSHSGQMRTHMVGCYLEANYVGIIKVTFEPDGTITESQNIKIWLLGINNW